MRLVSLKVENFMIHEHEELVLMEPDGTPIDGIFYLAGESRWGKSSLIDDAPAYALYGHAATRVAASGVTTKDLKHKDHLDEVMRVEARFVFDDGSQMIVIRGLDEKDNTFAEVLEPDPDNPGEWVSVCNGAAPVNIYIKKRLGNLSARQFHHSFVARQKEIDALSELAGKKRRDAVHGMLGIAELEEAQKVIRQWQSERRARVNALEEELGGKSPEVQQQMLDEARRAVTDAEREVADKEREIARLQDRREEIAKELAPLEAASAAAARVEELSGQIERDRELIATLRVQVKQHQEAERELAREPELIERKHAADERLAEITDVYRRSSEYKRLKAVFADARRRLDALVRSRTPVLAGPGVAVAAEPLDAQAIRDRIRILENDGPRLKELVREREQQLERLRTSGACYACERPFEGEHDHERVIADLEKGVAELRAELYGMAQELEELRGKLPQAEQEERKARELEREIVAWETRVESVEADLERLAAEGEVREDLDAVVADGKAAKAAAADAAQQLAVVQAARGRLSPQAAEQLAAAEQRQRDREAELAQARKMLEEMRFDADRYRTLTEERAQVERALAAAEGALPPLKKAIDDARRRLEYAKAEIAAYADKQRRLQAERESLLRLSDLQQAMDLFARNLAEEIRPALQEMASAMLAQASGGDHVAMELDDDYNISVMDKDGIWYHAALLSGGERVRANICLRLALTRLVSQRTGVPVRFLVYDEPLHSQDPGHVQRIMDLLDSLRGFFPQIFIISHVGQLEDSEHVDYKVQLSAPPGRNRIQLLHA
jgi:exonuclease SbcC